MCIRNTMYIILASVDFTGGMGTTYSLPRSPDDYLSNVDEMDMQEDGKYDLIVTSFVAYMVYKL
jgi:hypothetical protein